MATFISAMQKHEADFVGEITLISTKAGGRSTPAHSGYRPQHAIHENYQTSGEHEYLDVEELYPGESSRVKIRLMTPHVYPHCIWVGREINVQEGQRIVGIVTVTEIINLILECSPEDYKSTWVLPKHLESEFNKRVSEASKGRLA